MEPIFEKKFIAAELMDKHPPRLPERNKQIVFEIACPPGCSHSGTISFARYRSSMLPASISPETGTVLEHQEGVFSYEPSNAASSAVDWYLNFANIDLFCAYGARAFAQDELQVGEHPALGALREAMMLTARAQLFTAERGEPTPIVIMGVERRCEIATVPDAAAGRPNGLYGRLFCSANPESIRKATRSIDPATTSNILAIEAPSDGKGRYTPGQIDHILRIAYSGFRAAILETQRQPGSGRKKVAVHTGFWGCGVYGNNRVLITLLQFLAARLAKVDRLVFHTVDSNGTDTYRQALSILENRLFPKGFLQRVMGIASKEKELGSVLAQIDSFGFRWGEGDGN